MATLIKKLFGSRKSDTQKPRKSTETSRDTAADNLPDWSDKARVKASLEMLASLEDEAFTLWLAEQSDLETLAHALTLPHEKRRTQVLDYVLGQYTADPNRFREALSAALQTPQSPLGNLFRALPAEDMQAILAAQPVGQLRTLATEHPSAIVREAAASLIQDTDNLEALARHAKGRDKRVYRIARERLRALREAAESQSRQTEQAMALLTEIRQLAESQDESLYAGRLNALQQKWAALPRKIRDAHASQWADLEATCQKRADAIRAAEQAEKQAERDEVEKKHERQATLDVLERTVEELRSLSKPDAARIAALDALCKTQETRWLEASHHQPIEKAEKDRYLGLMGTLHHYLLASQRLLEHEAEIERLVSTTDEKVLAGREKALRKIAEDVRWPGDFPLPEPLAAVQDVIGTIETRRSKALEDQKKRLERARSQLADLATQLDEGHLKMARRLARDIGHQLDLLPEAKTQDLHAELNRLTGKLRELEDWKGFATRPKLEALIERMQQLAEQPMEPHDKARAIKSLQQEWRELGGSSDQSLWTAFKDAAEAAYAPLKAFFEEEEKLKAANLERRQEIVEQLELFLSEADWSAPDWKAVDKVNRKAREEWRKFFPVDPRAGRKLQKRFNQLLGELDTRLDEERSRNEAIKADIVERARALIDEPDIRLATQQAKALQKEWEQTGITHFKKDRALWKQFRAACDAIFERLGENRKAQEAERQALLAKATECVAALEALVNESNAGAVVSAYSNLRDAIGAMNLSGQDARPLLQRYQAACKAVDVHLSALKSQEQLKRLQQIASGELKVTPFAHDKDRPVEDTLLLLEILAGTESPETERPRRMALQVERLNQGLHGVTQADTLEQFESLLAVLSSRGALDEVRQARVQAALEAFVNAR
ncbi:MAG: DUF349 domain-containing protein [Gammaproteobacteria bacterium]|nr:MAG: DUF349 domain-containing protein [Gammaproteobacteria bacterium]